MSQTVHESRATLKLLSESSQINSSMGLHGHSGHHLICQPRSRSRDVENSEPPLKRGGQRWQNGSIVGQGQASKHAIANQKGGHAPSFIGKMQPSIGLVSASDFLGSIRRAEQHTQKTFVSVILSSLVLPYMCCRRQCSVRRAGSQGIQTTELFRTFQDVIVPEGPAVHCSTHRRRS